MGAERGNGFWTGLVVGAVVGGALALLLAQEELRDVIVGKAREVGERARDASGDVREKAEEWMSRWQSEVSALYQRGREIVDDARGTITASVDEAKSEIERLKNELKEEFRRATDA